jgi:NAD+ kinase
VPAVLRDLITFLASQNVKVLLSEETRPLLQDEKYSYLPLSELAKKCDLIIVVGGDGSLLSVSHAMVQDEVPILGINRGRLGFLTDIRPSEFEKITAILQGKYREEKRFLLEVNIKRHDKLLYEACALNEIVLAPGQVAQMLSFEVYVNDQFMYSQRSDGLILATPTGSTAYALSAGGPILDPELNAMVLVPVFPHSLTHRPIVLPGDSRVRIVIAKDIKTPAKMICDSQESNAIEIGDWVEIHKLPHALRLIHPLDYDYFAALRSKLHWGKPLVENVPC